MRNWLDLRALALLLGALTVHSLLWPIYCCAAKPTWSTQLKHNNNKEQIEKNSNEQNDSNLLKTYNTKAFNNDKEVIKLNINSNVSSISELFFLKDGMKNRQSKVLSRTDRDVHVNSSNCKNCSLSGAKRVKSNRVKSSTLDRNERSANLSHITGSARKIQLYIKNRFLQLLPDGTVNGTSDDLSDYTILQRTTVNVGQIKIQGVATCLFLCMDSCGTTYGSIEFTDDCIFNESMEQHHYNTYSSTHNSNAKRTLYLGLNRHGQPRKIQIPSARQLGKLATYTKSLTQTVTHERVDQLIARLYGTNHIRHSLKQLCETGKILQEIKTKGLKNRAKCNSNSAKTNKKKKRKRKCRENEPEGDHCIKTTVYSINKQQNSSKTNNLTSNKKKASLANNQQKKCEINTEDCNGRKMGKKKLAKKNNGNQTRVNVQKNNGKQQKGKKKTSKTHVKDFSNTTTLRGINEEIEHENVDSSLTSDELDDDDYEEGNISGVTGDTTNLIEDHDSYEYSS